MFPQNTKNKMAVVIYTGKNTNKQYANNLHFIAIKISIECIY